MTRKKTPSYNGKALFYQKDKMHCSVAVDVTSFPSGTEGSPACQPCDVSLWWKLEGSLCAGNESESALTVHADTRDSLWNWTAVGGDAYTAHFSLNGFLQHAACGTKWKHSFIKEIINKHCFAQSKLAQSVLGLHSHGTPGDISEFECYFQA